MRFAKNQRSRLLCWMLLGICVLTSAACGNNTRTTTSKISQQVLRYPNVGTIDVTRLDPASGPDANSNLAISMIFSGLVRQDADLNILPEQAASWDVSGDKKVYTFHLKPDITFSDGTPITAQSYIYTWTRALLPATKSPIANILEGSIVGSAAVSAGKTNTLQGVKALDDHTLQVALVRPTAYFLQLVSVPLFYPLNQKLIDQYGTGGWVEHVAGNAAGSGPFMVKSWQHNVKMVLVPNPHYYGNRTKLSEVDMFFVKDPTAAFNAYRAGQYDFVWGLTPDDQSVAPRLLGFTRSPILQSDLLFFNDTMPPFDKPAVRQAFAAAIDKQALAAAVFKNAVVPANTIIPQGEPGAQPDYPGIPFDKAKARQLLQSVYPDVSKMPSITFSFPSSQVTPSEAAALQQMWQSTLGIQVNLNAVELTAYNDLTARHLIQFGFTQWGVYFADPYEWLNLSLLSTADDNNGSWHNSGFDQTIAQAEQKSGDERLALYAKAERIAIDDVGWLPIDHQSMSAVIPPNLMGVTLNAQGLYFGDWSKVWLA